MAIKTTISYVGEDVQLNNVLALEFTHNGNSLGSGFLRESVLLKKLVSINDDGENRHAIVDGVEQANRPYGVTAYCDSGVNLTNLTIFSPVEIDGADVEVTSPQQLAALLTKKQ